MTSPATAHTYSEPNDPWVTLQRYAPSHGAPPYVQPLSALRIDESAHGVAELNAAKRCVETCTIEAFPGGSAVLATDSEIARTVPVLLGRGFTGPLPTPLAPETLHRFFVLCEAITAFGDDIYSSDDQRLNRRQADRLHELCELLLPAGEVNAIKLARAAHYTAHMKSREYYLAHVMRFLHAEKRANVRYDRTRALGFETDGGPRPQVRKALVRLLQPLVTEWLEGY